MKKVLFLLTFIFALGAFYTAKASHVAGADITYQYIGDKTGNPMDYIVQVRIYRDTEGTTWTVDPLTLNVESATCSKSFTVDLPMIPFPPNANDANGGGYIPGYELCGDTAATDSLRFVQFLYRDTVRLDGLCTDWVFWYEAQCCRNSAIDNLADLNTLLLVGRLNNTLGPNNSADFNTGAVKLFCKNRKFEWSQGASDIDPNDELLFALANPLEGAYPGTLVGYNAGYSADEPMTTINGFKLDSLTGVSTFTPAKKEFIVFKITVQDYRFNPANGQKVLVGEVMREIQIPVVNECGSTNSFETGPRLNLNAFGQDLQEINVADIQDILDAAGLDTASNPPPVNNGVPDFTKRQIPIITSYSCFDTVVRLNFDPKYLPICNSIDPTDFRIVGPDTVLRPVVRLDKHCNKFAGQTASDSLDLILEKPFDINGRYILFTKTGNDGNVLTDECGFELGGNFIMIIDVNDCPPLFYTVENVTVQEDKNIKVDWKVNPEYFAKGAESVFSAWAILKRNTSAGGGFYPQDYVDLYTARTWTDAFVTEEELDNVSYEYAIQLIQNGEALAPQNQVSSILLQNQPLSNGFIPFSWNTYTGWNDPQFKFFLGTFDKTTSSFEWDELDSLGNVLNYDFDMAQHIPAKDSGYYAFKVQAISLDPNINFVSESNWLYLDFRPEQDSIVDSTITLGTPYIPNVFTPNNDGFHDRFWISLEEGGGGNYRQYAQVSIEVYNRWGQLVYENSDFGSINTQSQGWDGTDMNSGQQLADGVYYYIINMKDPETFTEKNYKGHVTIFKNGQ